MKKATNRILSFLSAFAMVLGILAAPFTTASAAEDEVTETVTLHKLVMSKDDLAAWDSDKLEEKGYDGTQNTSQLEALLDDGQTANEVAGVYFAVKYNSGKNEGKYVTINETGDEPVYGAVDSLDAKLEDGFKLLADETTDNGIEFNTKGLDGDFLIEEIHEKSSYVGDDGEAITDSKAVPVEITLPLVNSAGVVKAAHVYPKNTEEKPQIDKNFAKAKEGEKELEEAEGFAEAEEGAGIGVGADYKNYQKKKATAEAEIGKKVPYEVKTEIPAKSNLAEAKWDDKMTEGLTYNKDLTVKIGKETITPTEDELTQTDNGFVLRLKGDNLEKLNGKEAAVTVVLTYSATVNNKAITDIPEANDVKFFYGNTPSKGTTPLPTKPNDNGEVTVEKTWDNGSAWEDGEWAKFKLVDANTGEDVTADDLDAVDGYTFESEVTLEKGGNTSYTWKGLKKDKQYKVIEVDSQTLSDAEYTVNEQGKVEITNHKSNNPKPLNPTEPKVVLGGRKFIKTNNEEKDSEDLERLAGAVFYVKNDAGQYLVADQKDATAVTKAKEALDAAVEEYNNLDAEAQTDDARAKVTEAQEAYNKAFKENATAYKWEDADTNAVELTSDGQGRFEIAGLEYGTYYLEEKEEPKGYAKLQKDEKFEVKAGSYESTEEELQYNKEDTKNGYGLQIKNKKVTIPETGGIGSLIFIVAGLALMGVAFVAMKRRNSYEEA